MKFSTASIIIASIASFANGKKLSSIDKATLKSVPTRRLQQEGCVLLLKQIIYEDHEEEQVECFDETTGQIVSLSAFESHILEMVKSGTIESGAATLIQEGAYFDDENRRLVLNGDAHPNSLTIETKSKDNRRKLFTGEKSFLALKVVAPDASTSSTESEISDSWFGTINDPLNFKSQMEACSYGKFKVNPANDSNVSDGVYTVSIAENVSGVDNSVIRNAAVAAGNTALGNMVNEYDHVMVCVPPGTTGGWIAYAYINWYLSVYNDQWCNYPSGQMHEIGHNLGLAHSGEENASEYADQSGMMGFSYSSDDAPNMCFNAPKNAQLGWYDDKLLTVSGTGWSGTLYGISDYESSDASTVIAKIPGSTEDWYVSFNRNTGVNTGTLEGANQVLVHKRATGNDFAPSTLMAKLNAGGSYNGAPLPITVNAISSSTFAQVTIGTVTTTAPTANPTSSPTASPTKSPTSSPVSSPVTSSPTMSPVASPVTSAPSKAPTSSPTSAPTKAPTSAPVTSSPTSSPVSSPVTSSPTMSPVASPVTSAPSKAPTSSPTSAPTKAPTSAPVTSSPTSSPVSSPVTSSPTMSPVASPVTSAPSKAPTSSPTSAPTKAPTSAPVAPPPTPSPTSVPTSSPTSAPTKAPTSAPVAPPPTPSPTSVPTSPPVEFDCSTLSSRRGRCRRKVGCAFNRFTKTCITAPTTAGECVRFNNRKGKCRKSGCFFNVNTRQCSGFYD